jgi:hypothetical protein
MDMINTNGWLSHTCNILYQVSSPHHLHDTPNPWRPNNVDCVHHLNRRLYTFHYESYALKLARTHYLSRERSILPPTNGDQQHYYLLRKHVHPPTYGDQQIFAVLSPCRHKVTLYYIIIMMRSQWTSYMLDTITNGCGVVMEWTYWEMSLG